MTYVLDDYDPHYFEAHEKTVLICVFNPPLTGKEIHQEDGSYIAKDEGFRSPVYDVLRVPIEKVKSNDYNPNSVAPLKWHCLKHQYGRMAIHSQLLL